MVGFFQTVARHTRCSRTSNATWELPRCPLVNSSEDFPTAMKAVKIGNYGLLELEEPQCGNNI